MARNSSQPLSVAEAKARLRAAAQQASLSGWVRRHPLPALGIALLGGYASGRLRNPPASGLRLARKIAAPLLLGMVRQR